MYNSLFRINTKEGMIDNECIIYFINLNKYVLLSCFTEINKNSYELHDLKMHKWHNLTKTFKRTLFRKFDNS